MTLNKTKYGSETWYCWGSASGDASQKSKVSLARTKSVFERLPLQSHLHCRGCQHAWVILKWINMEMNALIQVLVMGVVIGDDYQHVHTM